METDFDYIVVGGGSAGSVLAGRLSEHAGTRVCLLEAGGGGSGPAATVAAIRRSKYWISTPVPTVADAGSQA